MTLKISMAWRAMNTLQNSFMNVILAAAKRYEVEPFYSMSVPRRGDFKDDEYDQFVFDLEHYITQLVLDNSLRSRRDSVEILPKSKDALRSYVHSLRNCIETSQLTDAKREALLKKLDSFEAELEKKRLGLLSVAKVTFEVLAIPGALWASGDMTVKLVTNVMQVVAEARAAEHEAKPLPSTEPFKALMPPRPTKAAPQFGGGFPDDLDDDVPF
ncbi:hypothetical protein [Sphingomonas gei]|uniref:hypothetical protein n=1 Tax=Sphingomonas gei TaxID=1395960 RepID=UPI0019D145A7|nr:hypothetical protein [Sphingomonas gei]